MSKIDLLEKGDSGRTMMHAETANEVIAAVNRLLSLQIKPEGAGRVVMSEANVVLELKKGGGGELEMKTLCHLGAPAQQPIMVGGPAQPI